MYHSLSKNILNIFILKSFFLSIFSSGENGLRIGAFNVQVFGAKKMSNEAVVGVLTRIISRYDIILIQEIRDTSGTAIETLLNITNARNKHNIFKMKISPRLGRTSSKEQYAFLYRPGSGIDVEADYVYDDGKESETPEQPVLDTFEREPYVILFRSSTTKLRRFAFAGLHISPSEAVKELQTLGDVFDDIKARLRVKEVMVMGDLNADCSYVPKYQWKNIPVRNEPGYTWWINDDVDTTSGDSDCAYDRFISVGDEFHTSIANESVGVYDFTRALGINITLAAEVSDHYPIEYVLLSSSLTSGFSFMRLDLGDPILGVLLLLNLLKVFNYFG